CVADVMEHRFAGEESANRHAVNAAGEDVVLLAFDAVRVAFLVQPGVGGDEFRTDPRLPPARGGRGTRGDDVAKRPVDREAEGGFAQHTFEAAGNVKGVEL